MAMNRSTPSGKGSLDKGVLCREGDQNDIDAFLWPVPVLGSGAGTALHARRSQPDVYVRVTGEAAVYDRHRAS
jgi:hypothetical protein